MSRETHNEEGNEENNSMEQQELIDKKSAFGPGFRKWLRMKRALRLVQEQKYPDPMHVPRIKYKVKIIVFYKSVI